MRVDMQRHTIDFGPQAYFEFRKYSLSTNTAVDVRAFVRKLLNIARQPLGKKWLKRVVIEGYTDTTGTYLYNLNLSLNRSHKVLCVLLERPKSDPNSLTEGEQEEVRKLFLVGGYSFNSAKETYEESRRVELRLEFLGLDEERQRPVVYREGNRGKCQLR